MLLIKTMHVEDHYAQQIQIEYIWHEPSYKKVGETPNIVFVWKSWWILQHGTKYEKTHNKITQKTINMSNMDSTKNRWWVQVLVKDT